jgi:hypothetical protein
LFPNLEQFPISAQQLFAIPLLAPLLMSQQTIHFFYRSTGGDNGKDRPAFHSKMLCLRSFLRAWQPIRLGATLTFINDGPMPDDRLQVMSNWGKIVAFPGLGNSPSYRQVLGMATALPSTDLVYFAEDDYLYKPEAFSQMLNAFAGLPKVEYITLFDHLDRYTRTDDAGGGRSKVMLAGDRHWRTVESTCMTFGARVGALKRDAWIHRLFTIPRTPRDRHIWRCAQGLTYFFWKFPKSRLISPIPSLATHLDPAALAPHTDWAAIAAEVNVEINAPTNNDIG